MRHPPQRRTAILALKCGNKSSFRRRFRRNRVPKHRASKVVLRRFRFAQFTAASHPVTCALPQWPSRGTFRGFCKKQIISTACVGCQQQVACHLCNTSLKTAGTVPFQGGLLLCVHDCWAMVVEATEGGIPRSSRLGVSLKSLAFSGSVRKREATGRLAGIKGTNQVV